MILFNEKYRKIELFIRAEADKTGSFEVFKNAEPVFHAEIDMGIYQFLEIPIEKGEYNLCYENVRISQMYLSGNADIMETGIRYLMINGEDMEQLHDQDIMDTPYREQYHFTPFVNWSNDPNGLCWYKGYYHIFYQSNPHEQKWGNMYWGHAVSRDLLHWKHLPFALMPQEELLCDATMAGGAFSGSAVPFNEKLVLFFTRDLEKIGDPKSIRQSQWCAVSQDGITFSEEKELIPAFSLKGTDVNFRDPKVFYKNNQWYMVIASNYHGKGTVLLYASDDLQKWRFQKPLLQLEEDHVPSLECPDFFEIDGADVLLTAVMGMRTEYGAYQPVNYYIGKWREEHFQIESTGVCDFGGNFYAAQTFEHEGRRILFGWVCDWMGEQKISRHGAYGSFTLPRIVTLVDGRLYQKPAKEVYGLLGKSLLEDKHCKRAEVELPENNYYSCICFSKKVSFQILVAEDGKDFMKLTGDGKKLEIVSTKNKDSEARYIAETEQIEKIEIFMDRRVMEVYVNDGEKAGTKLFMNASGKGIFRADFSDGEGVESIVVRQMRAIWKDEQEEQGGTI